MFFTEKNKKSNANYCPLERDEILKHAKSFDIILFNNKLFSFKKSPLKNFSWTTFFVKIGSRSGWNHAALIMDTPPVDEKNFSEDCKYIYEYAASGQTISYQTLKHKIYSEDFNAIALIRFKDINKSICAEEKKCKFIENIKNDFNHRLGGSEDEYNSIKEKVCDHSLSKYKYDTFSIFFRTLMSICSVAAISTISISVLVDFLRFFLGYEVHLSFFKYIFLFFLMSVLIAGPVFYLIGYLYEKNQDKNIVNKAICSSYPPYILISTLCKYGGDNFKEKELKDIWINKVPPSPKNLYNIASKKNGYDLYRYK